MAACVDEAPPDLFEAASDEIFKLMERDTFSRANRTPISPRRLGQQLLANLHFPGCMNPTSVPRGRSLLQVLFDAHAP